MAAQLQCLLIVNCKKNKVLFLFLENVKLTRNRKNYKLFHETHPKRPPQFNNKSSGVVRNDVYNSWYDKSCQNADKAFQSIKLNT